MKTAVRWLFLSMLVPLVPGAEEAREENGKSAVDLADPPTFEMLSQGGLKFLAASSEWQSQATTGKSAPVRRRPVLGDANGRKSAVTSNGAKGEGGIRLKSVAATVHLRAGQAVLRLPVENVNAYFPASQLLPQSVYYPPIPRVGAASKVERLSCASKPRPLEIGIAPLATFLEDAGADTRDLKAWVEHKMWRSTTKFQKRYQFGKVSVEVNLGARPEGNAVLVGYVITFEWPRPEVDGS